MTNSDNHSTKNTTAASAEPPSAQSASKGLEDSSSALLLAYERKLDEVSEMITRVRHEINNPLTGVLGQAQLLLRENLDEKARRRVTTIEEQAIRIRDIVAQLRLVQKPQAADVSKSGPHAG